MGKIIPIHQGVVKNGELKVLDRPKMTEWIKGLKGPVHVIIRPPSKARSDNENRYYWGVVIKMIAAETGANPEDVHNELKRKFLRVGGEKIPITKSTTELTTFEFEDFLSVVRRWALEFLNLTIPLPNEAIY